MRLRRWPVQALQFGAPKPPKIGRPMPILKTIVEDATKQDFKDLCVKRGLSESEQLRTLVVAETQQATAQPSQGIAPIYPDGSNADLDRMTVRMPAFVMDGAKDRARTQGMAPSRWVASLVQSNLTAQPVMTDGEVEALLASNRELAAIGRSLSQMARTLNATDLEADRAYLEMLTELSAAVTSNRSEIRRLVRASRQAWGMNHEPD